MRPSSGVAAASHLGGRRFTRPRRLRDYLDWVAAGAAVPPAEPDARDESLLDTLMLARAPLCRPACAA
jgi:oxygen-independent coproporphyrinogen-3 oxidase